MASAGFNSLWVLCVILIIIAFVLAIRRRRLASREDAHRDENQSTHMVHSEREIRIHMVSNTPNVLTRSPTIIRPPPPAFDPQEQPPPSYQDFRKDIQIQPSAS